MTQCSLPSPSAILINPPHRKFVFSRQVCFAFLTGGTSPTLILSALAVSLNWGVLSNNFLCSAEFMACNASEDSKKFEGSTKWPIATWKEAARRAARTAPPSGLRKAFWVDSSLQQKGLLLLVTLIPSVDAITPCIFG